MGGTQTEGDEDYAKSIPKNKDEIVVDLCGDVSTETRSTGEDRNGVSTEEAEGGRLDDGDISGDSHTHSANNDNGTNDDSTSDGSISEDETEVTQSFEVTAYTANCEGCSGITYSGYDVKDTIYSAEGYRIIATDPSVIPTHTVVGITFSNGETLMAVALDIGGAIKGNRIDLLVNDYDEAVSFGRQTLEVSIY